ncbi:MAG: Vitamin K-dependent gamma-carboxylase [Acidobacteria bacterium]|nr:Vitamin K-dependent gamma-carboxylase [Acidobacteriota bacterium]
MPVKKTAAQQLHDLLFAPADPLPLGLFRIVCGLVLLARFVTLCLGFDPLFTADSPMSPESALLFSESPSSEEVPYVPWSLFGVSAAEAWARLLFVGYGFSIVALLVGWKTRTATLLVFLFTVSVHRREPLIWTGGDLLLQYFAFWLLFVPAGAALSLDAASRTSRAENPPPVRSWHLLLLQGQLALVYFSTFFLKIGTASWKSGTALGNAWQLPFYARTWSASLADIPGFSEIGTWATLAFELAFPIFIWSRRLRPWLLAIGLGLHLGIELTLRAGPFSAAMLAGYVPFLSATGLRAWLARLSSFRGATGGLFWQTAMLGQGKWVIYFNGNCGFCRRWIGRAQRIALPYVQWRDFNEHREEAAHLNPQFQEAAYLIIDQRVALPGFRAFRKLLLALPLLWPLIPFVYLPGARALGDVLYRSISIRYGPVAPNPSCARHS